jgi:hypothetical protein
MDRNDDLTPRQALWELQSLGFVVERIERHERVEKNGKFRRTGHTTIDLKISGQGEPPMHLMAILRAHKDEVLAHLAEHARLLDRHESAALRILGSLGGMP